MKVATVQVKMYLIIIKIITSQQDHNWY